MVEHAQPSQSALGDKLLLLARDGFGGSAVAESAAGFDFNESQRIAGPIPADEIDFAAAGGAEIPVEDLVALTAEVALGEALALAAQPLGLILARFRRAGEAPAEREEKIADESDKAHARGA